MGSYETGITETVRTFFSEYTVHDIIRHIGKTKASAVTGWLDDIKLRPERALIIGSYFTGAFIAESLDCEVTVVDINPQLKFLLGEGVEFHDSIHDVSGTWDLIVDTTGLGGVGEDELSGLDSGAFLVEDPTSDGSDGTIMRLNETEERLDMIESDYRGSLRTWGLRTKTSGTMTLTVEVLRRSMADIMELDGVLYSTATLEFFERLLFRKKDPAGFLSRLESTALMVSSLRDVDCDTVLERNLSMIKSRVIPADLFK
ncbi:putative protein MJ0489 [Methanothermobacter wolfeii]|nr:DUF1188 family protein [Methanothermobacter wolfeii]QHN07271.1 DUF1188 domain-containing protein [Methanothermobacter sp. THM-1]SCM58274.1 putative protein MJ0489 [Methanothermobacter wolfeii]